MDFASLERAAREMQKLALVLNGLELGIFDALKDSPLTAGALAKRLEASRARLEPLLEALVAMGYVTAKAGPGDEPMYQNHAEAQELLCTSSPGTRRAELMYWLRVMRGFSWLSEVIRQDTPRAQGSMKSKSHPSPGTLACLAARARAKAEDLLALLPAAPSIRVLDIGGGAGGYAGAIVEALPGARVTLFDLPNVIEMATELLGDTPGWERLELLAGDFRAGLPEGPFDAVLLANIVHVYPPAEAGKLIKDAARQLAPGGALIIRDCLVDEGREHPFSALLFGVHMSVFSHEGRLYSEADITCMMEDAGLEKTRLVRPDPEAEGAFVVAYSPLAGSAGAQSAGGSSSS